MVMRNPPRSRPRGDGDESARATQVLASLGPNPSGQQLQQAYEELRDLGYSRQDATSMINNPTGWTRALHAGPEGEPLPPPESESSETDLQTKEDFVRRFTPEDSGVVTGGAGRRPAGFRSPAGDDDDEQGIPPEFAVLPPEEQAEWLEENGSDLSLDQLETIQDWLVRGNGSADAMDTISNLVESEGAGPSEGDVEGSNAANEAQPTLEEFAAIYEETNGVLPDRARLIQEAESLGLPDPELAVDRFLAANAPEEGEEGEEGEGEQAPFEDIALSDWALQKIQQLTGGPVTPEIEQRIVEYWNLYHADDATSIDEVAASLTDPSAANQILVEAAVLDDVPDQGWTVEVPGRDPVTISGKMAANLFENYGFDTAGLTRMARLMALQPEQVPTDDVATNMLLTASVMSALNWQDELAAAEEADEAERIETEGREAELERRIREGITVGPRPPGGGRDEQAPGGAGGVAPETPTDWVATLEMQGPQVGAQTAALNWNRMSPGEQGDVAQWLEQHGLPIPTTGRSPTAMVNELAFRQEELGGKLVKITDVTEEGFNVGLGDLGRSDTTIGVQIAQERLRLGFERYKDVGLAVVYSVDPALAGRVAHTGGDPDKLTFEDEMSLRAVINNTVGNVPESWLDLVEGSPLSVFNSLTKQREAAGGGGGGAGRMRRVLDPVQVKTQFADLFNSLLLIDPSEELQNQVYNELQAALDASEEGMQFDASSRIMEFVRGSGRYKELYGKKPGGLTEEEYLGQFLSAGQSMLGAEAAPVSAIESGLRTGQYQTTIGATAFDQLAAGEPMKNSRFWGRLAEVRDVFEGGT